MKNHNMDILASTKEIYEEVIENEYWKEGNFVSEVMEILEPLSEIHYMSIKRQKLSIRFNMAVVVLTSINILFALVLNEIGWTTWASLVVALFHNYISHKWIQDARDTEVEARTSILLIQELLKLNEDWVYTEYGVRL